MKLVDVVSQLQVILPQYTNLFSDILDISLIVASGGVAMVTTDVAHGMKADGSEAVTLSNVNMESGISAVSKDGNVYTFTTSENNDLTEGWEDHESVTLAGFTDEDWNGSTEVLSVLNRKNFTVRSTNSIPVLNGNEVLYENRNDGVNGRYTPTVTGTKTFTITGSFVDGDYSGGTVGKGIRVAGIINPESIEKFYTSKKLNDYWMFVSMPDAVISKDRHAMSDASGTMASGQDIRMRLLDGFNLSVIKNTTKDISGLAAIDVCRHDLLLPVLKSVFGAKFPTGLSGSGDFKSILTGHGVSNYNRAIIEYSYSFEVPMDLTDDDTVEPQNTRAFLDVDQTQLIGGDDTENLTVNADLDTEPLP